MATDFTEQKESHAYVAAFSKVYRDPPIFGVPVSFYSSVEQIPAVETTDFSLSNAHERKIEKFTYFVILLNSFF